ncbi:MAG: Nre family DNA repair protein [Candidatus Bathyarchaeota archaeon]|nr:Nre family DNA repair protein [Candidatus Bathyarchaeota archaeon]
MKRFGKRNGYAVKGVDNLWIFDAIENPNLVDELSEGVLVARQTRSGVCVACKGSRRLCGKTQCPIMVRINHFMRTVPLVKGLEVGGASPPSVFIGRIGYPYVNAGPMVPPVYEDTSLYDLPELWFGKPLDEIISFRSMLIRGKHRVHARRFEEAGKIMELTRELALASNATNVELALKRRPHGVLLLNDSVQPSGPSAPIRDMRVDSGRWNRHIEKAYYDVDLKASPAVLELYRKGVLVTKIQRAFSVGAFGVEENRKLVPTRWSITAVDSMVSKNLVGRVKNHPLINEYRVYESSYLDNQFEILMIPDAWSFEAIEAWYPGTTWNPDRRSVVMYGDWEGHDGRTTYAAIGGCYYAARLATCELLTKERRQAAVIVLREARPGYIMPVGVWQVRENVRNAMRQPPLKFNTLEQALLRISTQFNIPIQHWMKRSKLVVNARTQKKLTHYA